MKEGYTSRCKGQIGHRHISARYPDTPVCHLRGPCLGLLQYVCLAGKTEEIDGGDRRPCVFQGTLS